MFKTQRNGPFKTQKNGPIHKTVIHRKTDDANLCPVLQWAHLINWIWTYPGTIEDTPVCAVWCNNRLEKISSQQVLAALQAACATIGSACLGFEAHKIGTHSLWSGAVMEMYLASNPVYIIMLTGRWSSCALLCYIRKQVKQFSKHVPKQMLMFWSFRTIPDISPYVVSRDDPQQCNHCKNAKMRHNIGCDMFWWVQLPASLFSTDQSTTEKRSMEEASSYRSLEASGEERVEITFNSKSNPVCTSCASSSNSHIGKARQNIKFG